ncbi:MAG: HD-GYP domain-containing protein [Treponema sp.]|nr:HD-GYP domain-containing protein [Treponema sp.]
MEYSSKESFEDNTVEDLDSGDLMSLEELEDENSIPNELKKPNAYFFNSFEKSMFPVLLIDLNFIIIYANEACQRLFSGFFKLEGNHFYTIFGKSFGEQSLRDIRETALQGINGFSWKGTARMKSRDIETVLTKVFVFPSNIDNQKPNEFVVLFDDVTEENKTLLRSVFLSLLEASKLKDNDTGKHISRVNYYSSFLAKTLYLKPGFEKIDVDFVDDIGFLASMHDVGKVGTPDDILNKEGPLSEWEWSIMQEHTKNGAFILSTYPNPMAKEIALSHHEKWDGTGYPFQLAGDMIPLSARIVTIADVYDALRMKRSYKPAYDHNTTVEKMMVERGSHFDPVLLDIFYSISDHFEEIYENNED